MDGGGEDAVEEVRGLLGEGEESEGVVAAEGALKGFFPAVIVRGARHCEQ